MADGGLKLEIDEALAERLRAAADASGETVEAFAINALAVAAEVDWAEDFARVAEYEATGRFIPADQPVAGRAAGRGRGALRQEVIYSVILSETAREDIARLVDFLAVRGRKSGRYLVRYQVRAESVLVTRVLHSNERH